MNLITHLLLLLFPHVEQRKEEEKERSRWRACIARYMRVLDVLHVGANVGIYKPQIGDMQRKIVCLVPFWNKRLVYARKPVAETVVQV